MSTNETSNCGNVLVSMIVMSLTPETLYVDSQNGHDANPGTKERPLLTINQAGRMLYLPTIRDYVQKNNPSVYQGYSCSH